MRKIIIILGLMLFAQSYGQFNSIGLYAGFGSDKVSNPYDFRMKPVFEVGAIYNQPIFFNLSMEVNIGFNSQRIISEGSTAGFIPPDPNYAYLNGDVMFRYWLVNDVRGFMSGKRSNCYVQADISQSPVNFYLTGGVLNEFLLAGTDEDINSYAASAAIGVGVYFYMPLTTQYEGLSPFFEVLSTQNLTPRFTSGTDEMKFSRWLIRVGLTYSFSPGLTNPFY
jgi:hypothetical protein